MLHFQDPAIPRAILWLFVVSYAVVGLSHLLEPARWSRLFDRLLASEAGAFVIAGFSLPIGLAIVLTQGWSLRPGVVATAVGWVLVIKATMYVVHPRVVDRVAHRGVRSPKHFRVAGVLCLVLAGVVALDPLLHQGATG